MGTKTINFSHDNTQYTAHLSEMISFNYPLDPEDAPVRCEYTLTISYATNGQAIFYTENMISVWNDDEFIKDIIHVLSQSERQI